MTRPLWKKLALSATLALGALSAWAAPSTIDDVLGRKVTRELPAKRELLGVLRTLVAPAAADPRYSGPVRYER